MSDDAETSIFFPLHTSVELFEDPTSPVAVVRAKEAAVLYDRLIFETGLLDATISPDGSLIFWRPPEDLTPEIREHARRVIPLGTPVTTSMGIEPGLGVPPQPEAMRPIFEGPLGARYIAEFQTGVLDDLEQFKPDWLTTVPGGGRDIPYPSALGTLVPDGTPVERLIGQLNYQDLDDHSLVPDADEFVRTYVYKAFNRDSIVALTHAASLNVTPLFASMVEHRGVRPEHAGADALAVTVPNIGALPWEAIVEFREHAGSQEARAKLREFEARGAEGEPERGYDYLRAVHAEVTTALFQAVGDLRPNLPEQLASEALLTAVSIVPVVGNAVAVTASVAQAALDSRRFNRSWIAALMQLQRRT